MSSQSLDDVLASNTVYNGVEYNYAYLIFCGFIVWLIIPGIALLYSGLTRRTSALSLLVQSLLICGISTFQWMFWGYSLAFSSTASSFIGDLANFGMMNVGVQPSASTVIPTLVYALYQLFFATCTVQLVMGASFERGSILSSILFAFFWLTIVYCPVACWTWNANGWLYKLPSFDFAGGGPVHMNSGWASLAYALVLGPRKSPAEKYHSKAHNTTLIFLGTALIWFGWFGFNGGSALNASMRAMMAAFNTNTAAAFGVLGWAAVDLIRFRGKISLTGVCEGAIAGLVGITPAAGHVSLWIAALIGFLTAVVCNLAGNINKLLRVDDGLDVFKLHGIGGIVGSFLTGVFAQEWVAALDGVSVGYSGGLDGNGIQIAHQLAEIAAIGAYSFSVTFVIAFILKFIPGMSLRVSESTELMGLDAGLLADETIGERSMLDMGFLSGRESDASERVVDTIKIAPEKVA